MSVFHGTVNVHTLAAHLGQRGEYQTRPRTTSHYTRECYKLIIQYDVKVKGRSAAATLLCSSPPYLVTILRDTLENIISRLCVVIILDF